jgi:hypothetical protein
MFLTRTLLENDPVHVTPVCAPGTVNGRPTPSRLALLLTSIVLLNGLALAHDDVMLYPVVSSEE